MTGEALKQIVDLLQPVAALAGGTPFEHSEVIQRCVDASEIALKALAQPAHVISEKEQLKQWIETTNYFRAKREYEPDAAQQCLDCGSNNIGIPATYDSLINSVKTSQEKT
jgi:hypothetical protein